MPRRHYYTYLLPTDRCAIDSVCYPGLSTNLVGKSQSTTCHIKLKCWLERIVKIKKDLPRLKKVGGHDMT